MPRDLDLKDIRIRARFYKKGLATEQQLMDAVEALLQQTPCKTLLRFSEWIEGKTDDLQKAGDGYDGLSLNSKKVIDFAVDRYIEWLKAQ